MGLNLLTHEDEQVQYKL